MNGFDCIIYESSGRWAASMRAAVCRHRNGLTAFPTLHETRSLGELATRLAERPQVLVLVEVRVSNVHDILALLSEWQTGRPQARSIALLALSDVADAQQRNLVRDALWAAGVVEVVESPRQLLNVLWIGQRHAEIARAAWSAEQPSILERARSMLPWQEARRPLG
jgi:hypothetical protein